MEPLNIVQRKIKKGDCVFFLHIPKTAGTTMYRFIMDQFPPEEVFIVPDENFRNHFADTYPDQLLNYRFFRQHASYDQFRLLPRKPVMITLLRNPVDRILSLYKHVLRDKTQRWHRRVVSDRLGIEAFMNLTSVETTNSQTRSLVGFQIANRCKESEDLLAIAKMRLHELDFFGIQERFDESMMLLCHLFQWELRQYDSFNIAPEDDRDLVFDANEIEWIKEMNQLDLELYSYAVDEFKKRVDIVKAQ